MKKLLCLLLALSLIPSVCFSESEIPLNTIWGIDIGMSAAEASTVAAKKTGSEFVAFPGGKEIGCYNASLEDSSSLFGIKINSISILPKDLPIEVGDTTTPWEEISISFDTTSGTKPFGVLYDALCDTYGEPSLRRFKTTTPFSDNSFKSTEHDFPYFSDGFGSDIVQIMFDSGIVFDVYSKWENVLLVMHASGGELSLYLSIYANKALISYYR